MSKLLSANFYRLFHSRLFWGIIITVSAAAVFHMLMGGRSDAANNFGRDLDYYYFRVFPYSGIIMSIFISMFIGTEYSDGTVRNKLSVGCTRCEIYFSNLGICFLAVTAFFGVWAVCGLSGVPYFGWWSEGIAGGLLKLLVVLFTFLSLTSIITAMAHLISSKATLSATAMTAALLLILAGSYFYNSLCEPKTVISNIIISADGGVEFGDEIPNPAYVDGKMRDVYEVMLRILPTGQQILIADEPLEQPVIMIIFSVAVTVISTAIGYLLFRKKDLK